MKCSIMLLFIWVCTVCKSTRLGFRIQRVNQKLMFFAKANEAQVTVYIHP